MLKLVRAVQHFAPKTLTLGILVTLSPKTRTSANCVYTGLHCLLRQNPALEKYIQFLSVTRCYPFTYTIDRPPQVYWIKKNPLVHIGKDYRCEIYIALKSNEMLVPIAHAQNPRWERAIG